MHGRNEDGTDVLSVGFSSLISTLEVRYRSHKHWQGKLMVQARERH